MNKIPEAYELKNVIDNAKEPLIFKNIINYYSNWTMNIWRNEFKDLQLPFRKGYNFVCKCGKNHPQWERFTETVHLTFDEFLKLSDNICNYWYYFDYKRMIEWFSTSSNIMKTINWSDFGYGNITGFESTIWIGTKGAHTPCHIDTYENNLVLQVFGEKKWILFPPNTNLKPTRIPYEESSIYSKINFFHPDVNDLMGLKGGREILLKPGDVLFVPQGWWHYVENISNVAISINVWIPTNKEKETHLHESIVQLLVAQLTKSLPDSCNKLLINPNNEDIFLQPLTILYEQIKYCLNNSYKQQKSTATVVQSNNESNSNNTVQFTNNVDIIIKSYPKFIQQLQLINGIDIYNSLNKQSINDTITNQENKCDYNEIMSICTDINFTEKFINAVCHTDVVQLISSKLIDEL